MDYKNDQKLRKTSNANVLQNFAFADHIVSHNVEDKPKWTRKCSHNVSGIPLTMWRTNVNEDAYYVESTYIHNRALFSTEMYLSWLNSRVKICIED